MPQGARPSASVADSPIVKQDHSEDAAQSAPPRGAAAHVERRLGCRRAARRLRQLQQREHPGRGTPPARRPRRARPRPAPGRGLRRARDGHREDRLATRRERSPGPAIPPATGTALSAASGAARAIVLPPPMSKERARSLTGPASGITGLFQTFDGLTERGWTLTAAASDQIDSAPAATARFARENVPLYIDSVYDGTLRRGADRQEPARRLQEARWREDVRRDTHPGGSRRARRRLLPGERAPASAPGVKLGS